MHAWPPVCIWVISLYVCTEERGDDLSQLSQFTIARRNRAHPDVQGSPHSQHVSPAPHLTRARSAPVSAQPFVLPLPQLSSAKRRLENTPVNAGRRPRQPNFTQLATPVQMSPLVSARKAPRRDPHQERAEEPAKSKPRRREASASSDEDEEPLRLQRWQ